MFIAKTKSGRIISLIDHWDKKALQTLCKTESLICPVCKEKVQMKLGSKRIWHFAHLAKQDCTVPLEKESQYHLEGKKQLYDWLEKQNIKVELEPYLSEIQQRPDLLIRWRHQTFAIEYQCATIETDLLIKRTKSYCKAGIVPLWILGGNRLKKSSEHIIKPSSFDLLMAYAKNENNLRLIYYCSSTNRFCIASSLIPFSSSNLLATTQFYNPDQLQIAKITNENLTHPIIHHHAWLMLKRRWRMHAFYNNQAYFTHWFYEKGVPLCLLPGEAGIPVKSMMWLKTEAILWQGWILLKFILPLKHGEVVSFQEIFQAFKREVQLGYIQVRQLPSVLNSHYSFAIMHYLQKLLKLGIISFAGNSKTFRKVADIRIPINIDEACLQDAEVFKRL